jgi:hypothetical protein
MTGTEQPGRIEKTANAIRVCSRGHRSRNILRYHFSKAPNAVLLTNRDGVGSHPALTKCMAGHVLSFCIM